jgi:hypothetical protein
MGRLTSLPDVTARLHHGRIIAFGGESPNERYALALSWSKTTSHPSTHEHSVIVRLPEAEAEAQTIEDVARHWLVACKGYASTPWPCPMDVRVVAISDRQGPSGYQWGHGVGTVRFTCVGAPPAPPPA